jgi:hypothetical protein
MISPSPRATLRVVKHLLEYARDEIRSLGLAEPERLLEAAILAIEDELATTNC